MKEPKLLITGLGPMAIAGIDSARDKDHYSTTFVMLPPDETTELKFKEVQIDSLKKSKTSEMSVYIDEYFAINKAFLKDWEQSESFLLKSVRERIQRAVRRSKTEQLLAEVLMGPCQPQKKQKPILKPNHRCFTYDWRKDKRGKF